jgi:hypothetical protein
VALDWEPVERLIEAQLIAAKQTVDDIFQLGLLVRRHLIEDFFETSLAEMGYLFEDVRIAVQEYQEASSVDPLEDRGRRITQNCEQEVLGAERGIIVEVHLALPRGVAG